jgi:hypothetical protein
MKQLNYLLLTACCLLAACVSDAQLYTLPVQGNGALEQAQRERGVQPPKGFDRQAQALSRKRDCDLEEDDILYVSAGDSLRFLPNVDTFGLDTLEGTLSCTTCADNPIGEAALDSTGRLVIRARPDLQGAEHTFRVEFCNPNGCNARSFQVVGRRLPRRVNLGTVVLQSEELREFAVPASELPGPLACNRIVDLPDDYEGQDKLVYFTTYTKPDSTIVYAASRHAGRDTIQVTVCDSFALCDDYIVEFLVQHDTLKLGGEGNPTVFLDDFSYEGPFPAAAFWLDKSTYVNDHFATDAPSIGMATFDGLNSFGQPYGAFGDADRFTSTYFDLFAFKNQEDVYLTFWLKPAGLGDWPDPTDLITLEFKNVAGDWVSVREFRRDDILPDTAGSADFFRSVNIGNDFLHEGFQFRFQAVNEGLGVTDIWNLDYVWLGRGNAVQRDNITDVAINQPPSRLLQEYKAMPWRHFRGREDELVSTEYGVSLFNNDNDQALNAGAGELLLRERQTGSLLADNILLNACCRTAPMDSDTFYTQPVEGRAGIVQQMASGIFDAEERLEFQMIYNLTGVTNEQDGAGYESVSQNNQVTHTTVFDDYFAYDDGSAERLLGFQEGGTLVSRFRAAVEDTLQGVQFHFPIANDAFRQQEFDIVVWVGELSGEPDFRMEDVRPFFPNLLIDTFQAFTSIPLENELGEPATVYIPPGDFYVGWEQVSDCDQFKCTAVGLDRNTPEALAQLFYKFEETDWVNLGNDQSLPPGALMIRPVLGSEPPLPTSAEEPEQAPLELRVYPNPASQVVFLELPGSENAADWRIALFNSLGQPVYEGPFQARLPLRACQNGMYWLKAYQPGSRRSVQRRLVVAR